MGTDVTFYLVWTLVLKPDESLFILSLSFYLKDHFFMRVRSVGINFVLFVTSLFGHGFLLKSLQTDAVHQV